MTQTAIKRRTILVGGSPFSIANKILLSFFLRLFREIHKLFILGTIIFGNHYDDFRYS